MIIVEFQLPLSSTSLGVEKQGYPTQVVKKGIQDRSATIVCRAFFFFVLAALFLGCGEKEPSEPQPSKSAAESFTFFDLGRNSVFSERIREELGEKLGHDAIEGRMILDLKINYPGFLKTYFPKLHELNRQLNYPPGERIDHNTIKLMYRYAQRQSVPFDYVELVFSNYTKKPILFRIYFQKDESNIVATLKQKYGEPQSVEWEKEKGKSFYWTTQEDVLIVSLVPDQLGNPEFRVVIYFTENLVELVRTEQAEKAEKERQRAKSGRKAF